ncbi:uncharacterized protein LOC131685986 isoform X1 [Topomyia yanbarensis]|uniref:uncharacterized protein LOC131685986 isoform X1 n=1 Tax=Topomyia yanbarensis TaxID=2498891 RepID=UPI00273C7742|nr:uncharacterized protein LOC131685986 isoform X1 [Topomyia yanbarensis]XP_058826045.1 uncharacterized protein LOC131685986 isoform X1 [Topomyia yanbarensis]XP_058826046.1 uncharacterized protein LOC131685986 isoform X1 [Topomyia yanbarensis]XP_058826047.1 uncharacterized protein LOC131685986 isoform X1 [Topomyia yanbarensis]
MSSRSSIYRRMQRQIDNLVRMEGDATYCERPTDEIEAADVYMHEEVRLVNQSLIHDENNDLFSNESFENDEEIISNVLQQADVNMDLNESDDNDDTETRDTFVDIANKLASWSVTHHISNFAMNDLIGWLKQNYFPELPRKIETLKRAAYLHNYEIKKMGEGKYVHFGLKNMLEIYMHLNNIQPNNSESFVMYFGIDGVPITKSSRSEFWPILLKLKGFQLILPVGVYHGYGKPRDVHQYLEMFVSDLHDVLQNGIPGKTGLSTVSIGTFVMDAQAKAFIMDIKAPTGTYGCPKCKVRGKKIGPRVVFLNLHAPLRTDEDFLEITDPHHHSSRLSPLATVAKCISNVSIDYMHNVLLGVFKYILLFWVDTKNKPYSLSDRQKHEINRRISLIKTQLPYEFSRRPRPLEEIKKYKATEFRLLLLYTGPLLFMQVVEHRFYVHFLLLHAAIRILCHPTDCINKNALATDYLNRFVEDYKMLYGTGYVVYNIHLLSHLAQECLIYREPLDNFSAFPFEEYLHKITKMTKKAPYPLEQLKNRLMEHIHFNENLMGKKILLQKNYREKICTKK